MVHAPKSIFPIVNGGDGAILTALSSCMQANDHARIAA
jgi:hypothetical protein